MKKYSGTITSLSDNQIFVFGSNTEGRHGKGAALLAVKKFGAVYGKAIGHYGQSYAICTKDLTSSIHPSVSKEFILLQIKALYNYARLKPHLVFLVAYGVSANLNGYSPKEMKQLFFNAGDIPENIAFNEDFLNL